MTTAAPLRLLGYSDAFTHVNIRMRFSHIHSHTRADTHTLTYAWAYTQRDMHTSIHTTATQTHMERAYNHMKDENIITIYLANSHLFSNIHINTHMHHMYVNTLAHESKQTESNHMRSYTIAQPDCHTDTCLHADTWTHSFTYTHSYTRIHTVVNPNKTITRVQTSSHAQQSSASYTQTHIYTLTHTSTKTLAQIQTRKEQSHANMKKKAQTLLISRLHITLQYSLNYTHIQHTHKHTRT